MRAAPAVGPRAGVTTRDRMTLANAVATENDAASASRPLRLALAGIGPAASGRTA